jgi:hypothetical protein
VTTVRIATKNAPQRYGEHANAGDFQRLALRGNSVISGQEIPDAAAKTLCPRGWQMHRPTAAKSEAIYWNPKVWAVESRGAFPLSSDRAPAPRFVVWVKLRHRETGIVRKFGSVHLVAFKTRNKAHGEEYRHQAERLATWLGNGERRVAMGDCNGSPDGEWLEPVMAVANVHTPPTKSGPHNDFIDLILTNKAAPHATKARVLNGYVGDHKPVEAELELTHAKKEHR